jgi:hypothetical protein
LQSRHRTSKVPKRYYDLLRQFIISQLVDHGELTLTELLDLAKNKLASEVGFALNWYLLEVKKDLYARGLIVLSFKVGCEQFIKIKPSSKRKLQQWLVSSKSI